MPKDAPGRNDPCHCGSGKKYKKCCLSRDEAAEAAIVKPHEHAGCTDQDHLRAGVIQVPAELSPTEARKYVERLEQWNHAGHDALDEGRFEEAESLAERLLAEYPEQIDGHELRAMVRLQQKRWAEAADGFEKAIAIALKQREDYDEEFIEELRREAEHARAHAEGRDPNPSSPTGTPHAHRHDS